MLRLRRKERDMTVLTFQMDLIEPLMATSLEGDANSEVSLPYIPGSAIRGALVGEFIRRNGLSTVDAADPASRRLFFDGTTTFVNAYPVGHEDQRCLPVPHSWVVDAEDAGMVVDLAINEENDSPGTKAVGRPFCRVVGESAYLESPRRHIAVHTQRDRALGRATALFGSLFRYDALAPEQTFMAGVLTELPESRIIADLLASRSDWTFGGARSAGHGRVTIHSIQELEAATEPGLPQGHRPAPTNTQLVVTFLSDAILRDRLGQNCGSPAALTQALSTALGAPLALPVRSYLTTGVQATFNRAWGLPTCQSYAVGMGSVAVYDLTAVNVSRDALSELERLGVGERRSEGYGRLAIGWQQADMLTVRKPEMRARLAPVDLGPSSRQMAQQLLQRILRDRLDRRLAERVNQIAIERPPTRSQVGRLRALVLSAMGERGGGIARIQAHLEDVGKRRTAREQFDKARIRVGGEASGLMSWLSEMLQLGGTSQSAEGTTESAESALSRLLDFDARRQLPELAQLRASVDGEMVREYLLRLLEGVLVKAAKPSDGAAQ